MEKHGRNRSIDETALSSKEIANVVEGICQFIYATTTEDREDRLWPADFDVFRTNPLNVACGACGIAMFLNEIADQVPESALRWMLKRLEASDNSIPPGLYRGIAGIALVLAKVGYRERGIKLLRSRFDDPMRLEQANFFQGLAGWGWACVSLYDQTGELELLRESQRAGLQLIERAEESTEGLCWPLKSEQEELPLGLGFGASGVALFLVALANHTTTDSERFIEAARLALRFELTHAKNSNGRLRWGADVEDGGTSPYLIRGTCGVGLSLLRYYQVTGESSMLQSALKAAKGVVSLFAGDAGTFQGMSALGQFLLDVYLETGEEEYLEYARQYVDSIVCFRIETDEGIAFPGRNFARISNDYGTGSAGVGLFLNRFLNPKPRTLYDLP